MKLSNTIRTVKHGKDGVDTLKISITPVVGELHEVAFTRESTNSRDPKVQRFYLSGEDMIELENTIKFYNEGVNHESTRSEDRSEQSRV